MTTVNYIFSKNRIIGEKYSLFATELLDEGERCLKVTAKDSPPGYFCIGGIKARLKDGGCEINISTLSDGEYIPKLVTSGTIYLCEPVVISGGRVFRAALYKSEAADIKAAIVKLSERLSYAEEKIAELSLKIEKKETLKF